MQKSTQTPTPNVQQQKQSWPTGTEAQQQQMRHETAIRIAGIEGVEGFADVVLDKEAKS